jgi:hypothetical protein
MKRRYATGIILFVVQKVRIGLYLFITDVLVYLPKNVI